MAVERKLAFQAQSVARSEPHGNNAEFFSASRIRSIRGRWWLRRGNVDLKSIFSGVARARDENVGQAANCSVREPVNFTVLRSASVSFCRRFDAFGPWIAIWV